LGGVSHCRSHCRSWFDVLGQLQRAVIGRENRFFVMPSMNTQTLGFKSQSQRCICPRVAKQQCGLQWLDAPSSEF